MGLCKCPKRRVTNQFCFEHRVNVCEYCMVTNHPKVINLLFYQLVHYIASCYLYIKVIIISKQIYNSSSTSPTLFCFQCIIQSYLQWLQDSDYNPICEICTNSLSEGECIRLTCYRKFPYFRKCSLLSALNRLTMLCLVIIANCCEF